MMQLIFQHNNAFQCVNIGTDSIHLSLNDIIQNQLNISSDKQDYYLSRLGRPISHDTNCCEMKNDSIIEIKYILLGGIDFQNRAGAKHGGGGVASQSQEAIDRRERLRRLAMETMDISKDPYFMRNNLGQFECKLCMTLHRSEANYMSHTQGKRHQDGLRRRAAEEVKHQSAISLAQKRKLALLSKKNIVRIGNPGYRVTKTRDMDTGRLGLEFEIDYQDAHDDLQPRHRFMSTYEQRAEKPDSKYQFVIFACDPYETIAFKIPSIPIDKDGDGDGTGEESFYTHWDSKTKKFKMRLFFINQEVHIQESDQVKKEGSEMEAEDMNEEG